MIKYILALCIILLTSISINAEDDAFSRLLQTIRSNQKSDPIEQEKIERNKVVNLKTPQSEVEDAILFLSKLPEYDAQFIRFFSTYAVKEEYREDTVLVLSFVIHSLVGLNTIDPDRVAGGYYPLAKLDENGNFISYRRVPSSSTLWWIDLREYNWTAKAWEIVSQGDAYFSEPVVSHSRNGILRLLAGNAILRADWFISHAMNTTHQQDINIKDDYYTTLLYASTKKPKNINEWRLLWGLDINRARKFGNEYGAISYSKAVSRHTRALFGYRTELGYMYETYDVTSHTGKRDYIESFFLNLKPGEPPEVSDAGEAFTSNYLGLQVYVLRNAQGDIVNFGDPTLVRHITDVVGDVRVRTAHSCIDCHASGPIPTDNILHDFVKNKTGSLKSYDKNDAIRIKRNMLSSKFEDSVEENQKLFAKALKNVNGLPPNKNGSLYLQSIKTYSKDIDLETAAFECGVTPEDFAYAIKNTEYRFGARLKLLVNNGQLIPRDAWETPGRDGIPGQFQQAMIILNGVTLVEEDFSVEKVVNVYKVRQEWKDVAVKSGENVLERLDSGEVILSTGKLSDNYWLEVFTRNGTHGYIALKYLDKIQINYSNTRSLFRNIDRKVLFNIIGESD